MLPTSLSSAIVPKLKNTTLAAQMVKNLPAVWESWVQSLSWEDPLEEGMETHSSVLAWRILMDRRGAWRAAVLGGRKESDTTERLTQHILFYK